jgi:apolipoprotein N-acyltransferase
LATSITVDVARNVWSFWGSRIGLATTSGLLLGFSFEGRACDALLGVAAVMPLAQLAESAGRTPLGLFRRGWWAGTVGWAIACHWIPGSLSTFIGRAEAWGIAAWLGFACLQGTLVGAFLALGGMLINAGAPSLIAIPIALVLAEWAIPLPFEHYLGGSLHSVPVALQLISLGGPLLLSGLLAFTSVCLAEGTRALVSGSLPYRPLFALLAAWVITASFGIVELQRLEDRERTGDTAVIAVIQENIRAPEKHRNPKHDIRQYSASTRQLMTKGPDIQLVVWPETVVAYRFDRSAAQLDGTLFPELFAATLVFGAYRREQTSSGEHIFNSAFVAEPDGRIAGWYDKRHLFPLSERVPLLSLIKRFSKDTMRESELQAGAGAAPIDSGPFRLGVLICYDEMFPADLRKTVDARANLLVSLSNDGWFGRSRVQEQHLALARLRAAETQRALVRSTNTGISAVLTPSGRVATKATLDSEATIVAQVSLLDHRTPYVRNGDLPCVLVALSLALGTVGAGAWRRRRRG